MVHTTTGTVLVRQRPEMFRDFALAFGKRLLEVDQRQDLVAVLDDLAPPTTSIDDRGKALEAADVVEFDRHPFVVFAAEAHQARAVFPLLDRGADLGRDRAGAGFGDHAGFQTEAEDVEDQGDLPVAENRRAGKGQAGEQPAERFDHDLLRILDGVDDEAELSVVTLQDDDVGRRTCLAMVRRPRVHG